MKTGRSKKHYVVCVHSREDEDLIFGKVYTVIADKEAEEEGLLRVIDESGEDYLYPNTYFASVQLSTSAQVAFANKG